MSLTCTFHNQNPSSFAWRDYNKVREAVRCKDINLIKHLVANGARVNGYSDTFCENTPLHLAVISRSPEIVKILLDNGADTNVGNAVRDTPLIMAARIENFEIVDLLLSHDVQLYEDSQDYFSHLHVACMRNRLDVVKRLLSMERIFDLHRGINRAVNKSSLFWPGFTPLHIAVYYGSVETVEYLLKCRVDIMVEDSKGMTPLHWAEVLRNEEIIDLLLAAHRYEFKNPVGSHGLSHFHIACTRDNPSIVEHFLKLGVDVNLQVQAPSPYLWHNWQPIDFALYYECPKVIGLLLKMNAHYRDDGNDFSADGGNLRLLKYEFTTRNEVIYNLFLDDKNDNDRSYGEIERIPYFHLACTRNDVGMMSTWLSGNAVSRAYDLNTPVWNEYTALHLAAKQNSMNGTKLLLTNAADLTAQDSQGKTPLHVAFEHLHLEIVNEMTKHITEFTENFTDVTGLSFLHILCSTDRLEFIENFLSKSIDVNARVDNESGYWAGFTPMDIACKFEQSGVVALLHRYNADIFIKNGSISDHFSLVFEDIHESFYLSKFQNVLLENLLKILSSPTLRDKYSNHCGISPLHALCLNIDTSIEPLKQYLETHKDEINQAIVMPLSRKYHKCTPMHLAMRLRDTERGVAMMEAGANPLIVDGFENTPLESAFLSVLPIRLYDEEAAVLFPLGIPVESLKVSHFFIACMSYLHEFVKDILNNTDDGELKSSLLNCRNDSDETPLHLLSGEKYPTDDDYSDRKEMLTLLLDCGANANVVDYQLQTPLHHAIDAEIMRILIDHGANVNIQNIYGETPLLAILRYCKHNNVAKSIIMLLENGADINIEDRGGRTCLTIMGDLEDDDDLTEEHATPVLKHVIKLELIGFNITEESEEAYSDLIDSFHNFDAMAFRDECKKEIELMKLKFFDRYTTCYDILFKSPNEMTRHCENDVLQNLIESNNDFPIYGFLLRLQMKNGRARLPLLENSKRSLIFLIGRSLPPVCLEMILDHLSDVDLKHVIMSERGSLIEFITR